jgi:hypothetical protein
MANTKFKVIFDPNKAKDINELVFNFKKRDPKVILSVTFSTFEDAKLKHIKIFQIKKQKAALREIPLMKFA